MTNRAIDKSLGEQNKATQTGLEYIDRACYTDNDIFAEEQVKIFQKTWLFVAHVSELDAPGKFRTCDIAGQPVIAIAGQDGQIRVLFNSCRHKGTTIVEERDGQLQQLKCPYHHWCYDMTGCLRSVPRQEGYGPDFNMGDNSLIPVPRVEQIYGMIFANLDPDAIPLSDYLGPADEYLKDSALYGGEELVSIGCYEYSYPANWKLLMENTLDDYHAEYLHGHAFAQRAKMLDMEGTSGFQETEGSRWSVALDIHGAFDQHDDIRTLVVQKTRPRRVYVGIFPSFISLYHPIWDVTGFRIIEPIAVDRTIVHSYCLAPKSSTHEQRKAIGERYHYSWGPGGRAGVDDIEIFKRVQHGLKATTGGPINTARGMHRPGSIGIAADDHAVRGFWNGWRRYMQA